MRHIETIIWIFIITLTIGIILWCVFPKKNITESLLVSPIKLYSSNNKQVNKICEIDNNNSSNKESLESTSESDQTTQSFNYADYISISDYLSIKNENPNLRPGRELIGKKIRIKLVKFEKEYIPQYIQEEDGDCYSNDSEDSSILFVENNEEEQRKEKSNPCKDNRDNKSSEKDNSESRRYTKDNDTSVCALSEDEYSTLATESGDESFSFSDYYKCENDYCWYDANIINYSMTNYPCSMHKIEWKNEYGIVENKWISLHDYEIEVPVKPHSVLLTNEIGDNSSTNPYYFWKTSMESGYSVLDEESPQDSCTQPLRNNNVQNAYLNKNYFGNISCSTNQECSKYGSLYCDGGYCSTKYIQL